MTPPPLPAVVVAGGLAWNLARSHRNRRVRRPQGDPIKPTICRWACRHKRTAVTVVAGTAAWLLVHLARYVIDEVPTPL